MKIIPLLLAAYLSSLPIVSTAISADDVLSGEWILLGPQGLPIGKMTITQIGDRLSVSGPGWKGTGSFDGKAGYYDWTFLNGASGRTTITFDDQTKILQGTVKGTGINLVYNGQKVEVEKRERRSIGQTPTSSIRAPGKSTTQPKTAEKVDGPEIVGKNVFRNLTCESLPHYGAVFMYVDETTDLAEPQIAHEMLAVAAEYVKKYCPHVRGYRNISVAINFKSKLNEKLYPYNSSISARNYDEDKLIWQEYSNRETVKRQQEEAAREAERQREIWQREQDRQQLARQQMIQAIQDKLAAFLKSSGVSTTPTLSTVTSNPFLFEGKKIATSMMFERMMSKDEALFGNGDHAVIVSGVPSDRFTAGEYEILVAGTVKGNRSWKNSFGGELMVPLLKYIDSIDVRFSDEDLNWAKAQAGLE